LEKIGTIVNHAGSLYAFSGQPQFPLTSPGVEVEVLRPVNSLRERNEGGVVADTAMKGAERTVPRGPAALENVEGAQERQADQGARPQSSSQAGKSTDAAQSGAETERVATPQSEEAASNARVKSRSQGALRKEGDAVGSKHSTIAAPKETSRTQDSVERSGEATASEKSDSVGPTELSLTGTGSSKSGDQQSRSVTREAASASKETAGGGVQRIVEAESQIIGRDNQSREEARVHASDLQSITREAGFKQMEWAASGASTERVPTLHKAVSKHTVLVNERFEYVVEFSNTTPLDISQVEILDALHNWLVPDMDRVRVEGAGKDRCWMEGRMLNIRIRGGVPRGRTIKVHIPVKVSTN
jgi:hypothetical protein